jgi:hypothetical protein
MMKSGNPATIMPVPSMFMGCPQQNFIRSPIPASGINPNTMSPSSFIAEAPFRRRCRP